MQSQERQRVAPVGDELSIPVDPVNEQIVISGMLVDETIRVAMVRRLMPDYFQAKEHRPIFSALREMVRRKLVFDVGTLQTLAKNVDSSYVQQLLQTRPTVAPNFDYHVKALLWDFARASTAIGPLASFLEAIRDQRTDPERLRSLGKQLYESISAEAEMRYLRDPEQVVNEQMQLVDLRTKGIACYPYGIPTLDYYETLGSDGQKVHRMVPGAAPGQLTVITAVPGAGKSTLALQMAIGLVRAGRKPALCAWEQNAGTSLEILACMVLGWSRMAIRQGRSPTGKGKLTEEERGTLRQMMRKVASKVRFIDNPFNRSNGAQNSKRDSNDRNLDLLQAYIEASGCDVFIADLWKRALRYADPEEEEQALIRQQAMVEELQVHGIIVQQQRAKEVEEREDKRPTRATIKGSGTWFEVSDTIIGVHRPGLWTGIDDAILELYILKQRYGCWPLAVRFEWDADKGSMVNGVSIPYDESSTAKPVRTQKINKFFNGK
jgi:replicative DNA helicase